MIPRQGGTAPGLPPRLPVLSKAPSSADGLTAVCLQEPSFHISLAWCVGDLSGRLGGQCLRELQVRLGLEQGWCPATSPCQGQRVARSEQDQLRCLEAEKL